MTKAQSKLTIKALLSLCTLCSLPAFAGPRAEGMTPNASPNPSRREHVAGESSDPRRGGGDNSPAYQDTGITGDMTRVPHSGDTLGHFDPCEDASNPNVGF